VVVAGTNHFSILEELVRPSSPMFKSVVAPARSVDAR
jgi:hypothetical protein